MTYTRQAMESYYEEHVALDIIEASFISCYEQYPCDTTPKRHAIMTERSTKTT